MFTGPDTARAGSFPVNLVAILGCAELSYWLIERPSIRWRMKFRGNSTQGVVHDAPQETLGDLPISI
jgi:peptidoglycan/LPS O-acetylase OafA/YrhL